MATASQALEMDQLQGPGAHTWFRAVLQGNLNLSRKKISPWLGPSHSGSLEDVQGSKQKPTENPNIQMKSILFKKPHFSEYTQGSCQRGDHRLKQMDVPSSATYHGQWTVLETVQTTPLGGWHFQSLNMRHTFKKQRLPWWSGGWESACNAGNEGSMPGRGRSHVPQLGVYILGGTRVYTSLQSTSVAPGTQWHLNTKQYLCRRH